METRTVLAVLLTVLAIGVNKSVQQISTINGTRCVTSLDMIFALDGSNSMGSDNFATQKESMVNLINSLSVNESEIRVGVVLFSGVVADKIQLTGNREDIVAWFRASSYPDEHTRTDLAITEAINMFKQFGRNGSVPQLLMIVTDGESSEPDLTLQAANQAKAMGINIFAIGVTDAVDVEELKQIVSKNDQLFLTDDFSSLESSLNNATNRACVNLECADAYIDIVFVLDSSDGVGTAANFEEMKNFVRDFLIFADVDGGDVRVGLMTIGDGANIPFQLSTHIRDQAAIDNAIDFLQYRPGGFNPADAFEKLRTVMYTEANGDRADVNNVVIFLTASDANLNAVQTIQQAEATRAVKIQIYAVGISLANPMALDGIASKPLDENRFLIDSFYDLRPVITRVYEKFNKFCETPPPVPACYMGATDLWLVVDVSSTTESMSMGFDDLKNGLSKMLDIIQDPSVENPDIRVGMVAYSDMAQVLVNLTSMNSVDMTANAIEQLPGGVSQGGSSLAMALQKIVDPPVMSDYRSYVAIVAPESALSTGTNGSLQMELNRLKELGYTVVVWAVRQSGMLDLSQVQMDASGPKFFYFFPNYTELEAATKNFTRDTLCGGPGRDGEGLCAGSGHRENGYGVVAHPFECDKYIQCYYNEEENLDLGVVRECPMGLHWNSENKTCTKPCEAQCPYDRCKEDCEPYKMAGACGAYWECEDGVSKPKCCQQNFSFVPGVGCQLDFNCQDFCGPEKWCGMCQKKPNWDEPAGYDVMIMGGHIWMPRPCFYEDFDIVDCGCTAPRGHTCPADRMYDFQDKKTMEEIDAGDLEGIRVSDIMENGEGIQLKDKSAVHVSVNPMDNGDEPFTLHFRYKEEEPFSPYGETLLSSGMECGKGNTLLISANDKYIFAEIRSPKGQSYVKVPTNGLKKDELKDLVLSLDEGMLALSISDGTTQYIAQTAAHGNICFSCGLDIGEGLNKLSFEGTVQKIAVYSCAWPILY